MTCRNGPSFPPRPRGPGISLPEEGVDLTAHREFLAVFDQALRGGALPPGLTARDPQEIGRRFDVYRNNVASGLSQALATRFPVVRRLVGDEFFTALARLYAETDRPRSPVLAEWGAGFAINTLSPEAAARMLRQVL